MLKRSKEISTLHWIQYLHLFDVEGRDIRSASDYVCSCLLKSIRFTPKSSSDSYTSGIHRTGVGFGGLGYSYWQSRETLNLHGNLAAIRKAVSADLSFTEAEKLVSDFCELKINPLIAGKFHWQTGQKNLDDEISDDQRSELKNDFFLHALDFCRDHWHWVPLNSIFGSNYSGINLILQDHPSDARISPKEMAEFLGIPLLKNATKYAGIKARSTENAKERLGILLGALFLCMYSGSQNVHTMGESTTGFLTFEKGKRIHSSRAHLPYLAHKIEITEGDFRLLSVVERLFAGEDRDRKLVRSLRWISASWFAIGAERFSLVCQAIDALTPSEFRSMRAKCSWICEGLGGVLEPESVEMIFKKIRSDVAHGDAPSLIESPAYLEFLSKYGVDPELAAVEILRKILVDKFLPEVSVRPHPFLAYPDFVESQKNTFARYGMDFSLPQGFDFSLLAESSKH